MRHGRLKRSGLRSLAVLVLVTVGALGGVLAAGWGPKMGLDLEGGFAVTLQPAEEASEEVLDQAIEVIRSRVDALGVAEPEITRQGETIDVSLPGVTDAERARELVGQTAELRFRPVLSLLPIGVDSVDDLTTTTAEGAPSSDTTATTAAEGATTTAGDVEGQSAGRDATPFQDTTTTTAPAATTTTVAGATTTTTAPPLDDLSTTPREEDDPEEQVILEEVDDEGEPVAKYVLGPAAATGRIVQTARAELQPTGEWAVALEIRGGDAIDTFNQVASECFNGAATCPSQRLAIVLDSQVVSAPTIQQPSYERDQISISGSFNEAEAKNLALVLRYGSLPVALEVQQTRDVSATLGSDSLRAGVVSALVGLALVALYMVVYYRLLGVVAIGSLAVSGGLMWAVISWLGESRGLALTLAGITGIIVSIGVAVDSNVVFYEHLKEEVWGGRTPRSVASASFNTSFRTIVTANMASLIGAVLLYVLTVGSVRGFALFLAIGTVLDMVASYWFMRPMVLFLAKSKRFAHRPRLLGVSTQGGVHS
jgi:preprotein translocase subunit SecD